MRDQKHLIIRQLDKKLAHYRSASQVQVPAEGWIRTIRTSLHMTMKQLASRLNMTIQGITDLESREARGAVTVMSLREAARALDMQFVYGFVPNADSLDSMVDARSHELAKTIVLRTHQTMHLEDQANKEEAIDRAIEEVAAELKRNMSKSLWD